MEISLLALALAMVSSSPIDGELSHCGGLVSLLRRWELVLLIPVWVPRLCSLMPSGCAHQLCWSGPESTYGLRVCLQPPPPPVGCQWLSHRFAPVVPFACDLPLWLLCPPPCSTAPAPKVCGHAHLCLSVGATPGGPFVGGRGLSGSSPEPCPSLWCLVT